VSGTISPGGSIGTLTVGALKLETGASATFDVNTTNTVGSGVNDLIQVNGNLTLNNNALTINLAGVPQPGVPYRLINYTGTRTGTFGAVTVANGNHYSATLDYSVLGQVNITLQPALLRWHSFGDTTWDVNLTANWTNVSSGTVPDIFLTGDRVLLDDEPGLVTTLAISTGNAVIPTEMIVDSTNNVYTIQGPGKISGAANVVKKGQSTLTITAPNDYTGATTISNGILQVGVASALGAATGATVVTNSGTLDAHGFNLGNEPVTASGDGFISGGVTNGAIANLGGADQTQTLRFVTLAGNTTFGGTTRWDIRGTPASLTTQPAGSPYKITKVGNNQIALVATTVDSGLGDVDIQQGIFAIQTTTVSVSGGFGNPANTITVRNGASLGVWDLNNQGGTSAPLNKKLSLEDGSTVISQNGFSTLSGAITVTGNANFDINNSTATTRYLLVDGIIGGTGGFTKLNGLFPLVLSATNTYTGSTIINIGELALTNNGSIGGSTNITIASGAFLDSAGRTDGKLTLASGQKLQGFGTVNGKLTVGVGATLSPGDPASANISTFSITNDVLLLGTTFMEVDKGAFQQDQVVGSTSITYGGTLVVTNLSQGTSPLANGDAFPLFVAPSYGGSFGGIVPASPGAGLQWDTSTLTTDGTLRVALGAPANPPTITSATRSGSNIILQGTNGVANSNYYVLGSTNLLLSRTQWTILGTGSFDGSGNFSFTNPVSPAIPRQFYILQVP
jgi:autotransporter-associated beta strand protein